MKKQPARQKCQPKIYTESDFQRALRTAVINVAKQNIKITVAAFALTMHRKLGLNEDQISDLLVAMNEISDNALCFQDVRKELKEEVGLDIDEFAEGI